MQADDVDRLAVLLSRRATEMVDSAVAEGERRAQDYAASGGRHRQHPGRYTNLRRSSVVRQHHATGAQKVRMIEHVLYHHFVNFFGDW